MEEHGVIVVQSSDVDSPSKRSFRRGASMKSSSSQPILDAPDMVPPPDKEADVKPLVQAGAHKGTPSWLFDPRADELCGDFTLHAIPRAMRVDTSLRRRLIWFTIFLIGLAIFLWLAIVQISEFSDRNTNTNVALIDKSYGAGLAFPSITIWNQNPVRRSAVENTVDFSQMCSTEAGVFGDASGGFQRYPLNWTESQILSSAHQLDSMLIGCTFQGRNCSASDFYTSITPFPNQRYGVAYTFNIYGSANTYLEGPDGGLSLGLLVGQDDYCPRTWGAGIAFELHHHGLLTNQEATQHINPDNRVLLQPGVWSNVELSASEQNHLGPPYGDKCIDLSKGDTYLPKTAALDCAIQCAGFEAYDTFELEKFNRADFLNTVAPDDIGCLQDCFNLTLTTFCQSRFVHGEVTTVQMPSKASVPSMLLRWPSLTLGFDTDDILSNATLYDEVLEFMHENLIVVNFYFSDLTLTQFNESAAVTVGALIANIGGLSGLFLGASAISFLELIEIVALLGFIKYHDRRLASASKFVPMDSMESVQFQDENGNWVTRPGGTPASSASQVQMTSGKTGVDKYLHRGRRPGGADHQV
eukprot:jgi/Chlat1/4583/Chrsp290S04339